MTAIPRCTQDRRGPQRFPVYKFSHILKVFLMQLWDPTTSRISFPLEPFLRFLKQILSEDSVPCVLITLTSQSTSNASNSACWNGLLPVFRSNFTQLSSQSLEESGWNFQQTFWDTPSIYQTYLQHDWSREWSRAILQMSFYFRVF